MKKITTILLVAVCVSFFSLQTNAIAGKDADTPEAFPYSDVSEDDWYYKNVKLCYETGLMLGIGNDSFAPNDTVTIQQGITIIARLHQRYNGNPEIEQNNALDGDWFSPYYDYCLKWKLLDESEYKPSSVTTRESFAALLTRAYPDAEFSQINEIESIPGYDTSTEIGRRVLMLYKAGVLTGIDSSGVFAPYTPIKRGEIAALICRVIEPDARIKAILAPPPDIQTVSFVVPLDSSRFEISDFDGTYIYAKSIETGKRGVFTLEGEEIIAPQNGHISRASNGIFRVSDPHSGDISYFDTKGTSLTSTSFRGGTSFSDGFAAVQTQDGVINIINTSGIVVRSMGSLDCNLGRDSLSGGYISSINIPHILIDAETGKKTELPYFEITPFYNGVARVRGVNAKGEPYANLMNTDLNTLFSRQYKYIQYGVGYFPVTDDLTNWGVADISGKLVIPMVYSSIEPNSVALGLFTRQGSLTLRGIATENLFLELPSDKGTSYQLFDRYILKIDSEEAANHKSKLSVISFSGYQLFTKDNTIMHWPSENGLICFDGRGYYYFNIT